METLKFDITEPFLIASGGEQVEATLLEILGPNNSVIRHVTIIDNEFNKAIFKFSKESSGDELPSESDKKAEFSGNEIIMALCGGGGDVDKCYSALKSILVLGENCKVNGGEKFTTVMWDKMSYTDTKDLLGRYIKFFLASSLNS